VGVEAGAEGVAQLAHPADRAVTEMAGTVRGGGARHGAGSLVIWLV
jgi:hypothetical protein